MSLHLNSRRSKGHALHRRRCNMPVGGKLGMGYYPVP